MHNIVQSLLIFIFRLLFWLLTRVEVHGLENFDRQGAYIVAANHLSMIEVPLVYLLINRRDLSGLVAKKHQKNFLFRTLVNVMHGIWLNREEADSRAFRASREHLKQGGVLGLSPEGTRSQTGGLIRAKTGVAYLASQSGVSIVPVGVAGTLGAGRKILALRRPRIVVRIGEPFCLPPLDRRDKDASLREGTDEIMCRIAALLPPELRGVYAGHPRTQELIAAQASE